MEVQHEGKLMLHDFTISDGVSPKVLGGMCWKFFVYVGKAICKTSDSELNRLLSQLTGAFKSGIGTLKNVEIDIPIDPNAKPFFLSAPSFLWIAR